MFGSALRRRKDFVPFIMRHPLDVIIRKEEEMKNSFEKTLQAPQVTVF